MPLTLMPRDPELGGEVAGQPVQRVLRHAVDPAGHESAGRQTVHDSAAAALGHRLDDCLSAQQRAAQVHVENPVPVRHRHVRQPVGRQVGHDGCVVDQDVDPAERVDRRRGHLAADSAEVTSRRTADGVKALAASASAVTLRRVEVEVGDHHGSAGSAQRLGIHLADAARSARHHSDLAGQVEKLFHIHPSITHILDQ